MTSSRLLTFGLARALERRGLAIVDEPADHTVVLVDRVSFGRARADCRAAVVLAPPSDLPAPAAGNVSLDSTMNDLIDTLMSADSTAPPASSRERLEEFTPREREIALLVARGLTNQQVASTLQISPNTVRTHLHNMMSKIGVGSRQQLAASVMDEELGVKP